MINRNNYEEYLLMYLDGELSPAEKASVESFLDQNPDLKEELELLKQAVLLPETESFDNKASLYRKEEGIQQSNYQDYFLLYIDNELTGEQREETELFVLQNPALQQEFTLLKETVLEAEPVQFANKEILYRKEAKIRPIAFNLRWASLAAAVMTGVIAFTWILNNDGNQQLVTVNEQPPVTRPVENNSGNNTNTTAPVMNEQAVALNEVNPSTPATATVKQARQESRVFHQAVAKTDPVTTNRSYKEEPAIAAIESTPVYTEPGLYKTTAPVVTVSQSPKAEDSYTTHALNTDVERNYIRHASYNEELQLKEEKKLLVGSVEINPDKMRGLIRRASRFLNNKAKSDDEENGKVKIANIEVNKL